MFILELPDTGAVRVGTMGTFLLIPRQVSAQRAAAARMMPSFYNLPRVQIDVSASGDEALALVRADGYGFVVADRRMSGMDGVSFVKTYRRRFP